MRLLVKAKRHLTHGTLVRSWWRPGWSIVKEMKNPSATTKVEEVVEKKEITTPVQESTRHNTQDLRATNKASKYGAQAKAAPASYWWGPNKKVPGPSRTVDPKVRKSLWPVSQRMSTQATRESLWRSRVEEGWESEGSDNECDPMDGQIGLIGFVRKDLTEDALREHQPPIKVVRLSSHAIIPTRATWRAAGLDLYSAHDKVIPAHGKALVPTDLIVAVPLGAYGRVAPRSGLTINHFIDVGAGVIDSDFRGHLRVVLFNFGGADFIVKRGRPIAQLIVERIYLPQVIEVCEAELDETERGACGFGSTDWHANDVTPSE